MRSDPLDTSLADYEERYSLTGSLVLVIIGCLALIVFVVWGLVVGLTQQTEPRGDLVWHPGVWGFVATSVVLVAWYCGYCVGWLVAAMTGQVALRVNRRGVLLGRVPFPPRRSVLVPWSSIDDIVAFKRSGSFYSTAKPFIGIRLRPDAPRPSEVPRPGTIAHRLRVWNNFLEPVSPDLERMMRGWDLDMIVLQRSVCTYGPHVRIFNFR